MAMETMISATLWVHVAREELYVYVTYRCCRIKWLCVILAVFKE